MYLKSLEMCGFKSFADRTKLVFEPGLIAIVGPNGCGKSNVSDAIRWVLGEQRASALRGSKMLDVIFNGTDTRKQMGMCEVSITFADCDSTLDTEFNEVTITRRVFRTGDSGYFINKTPCRLKDIQRLFMGTGVGTTSYSVMAQGQIDAILSSRPEDRRTIFEEAAGITKYKADRKEALRKLEQTEANLVRIADVIREIKRQIGSLQRQAAKAERFKTLKSELRILDLYTARLEIADIDQHLTNVENELAETIARENAALEAVADSEAATASIRAEMAEHEEAINAATEIAAQDASKLEHSKEIIAIGEQRIADYRAWADRDSREASEMRTQLTQLSEQIANLEMSLKRLDLEAAAAHEEREIIQQRTEDERQAIDNLRRSLQAKRDESLERERRTVFLQNRLSTMDAKQHAANVQRERLIGEHDKIKSDLELLLESKVELEEEVGKLTEKTNEAQAACDAGERELENLRTIIKSGQEEFSHLTSQLAAHRAKLDLLREQEQNAESFQAGSKLLLDPTNPLALPEGKIKGALADRFSAPQEYRTALEAALRAWIDAVVIDTPEDAIEIMDRLQKQATPTRLVALQGANPTEALNAPQGLKALIDIIKVDEAFAQRAKTILKGVYIAEDPSEIPAQLSDGITIVTKQGQVYRADGLFEFWSPEAGESPLARRMEIDDSTRLVAAESKHIDELHADLKEAAERENAIISALSQARSALDEIKREAAQKEGALNSVIRDVERSQERLEVVASEMRMAIEQNRQAEAEKDELRSELEEIVSTRDEFLQSLEEAQEALKEREREFNEFNRELIDARLREANRTQELNQTKGQIAIYENRIDEIKHSLEGRSKGIETYDENITQLTAQINTTREQLIPMQRTAEESRARLEQLKVQRAEKNLDLQRSEYKLSAARQGLDAIRARHSALDVEKTEVSMRRQSRIDRVQQEYALSTEQILKEELPEWENGEPTREEAKARIEELNKAIAEIGPVNLVAIEEYQELEERFKLESTQEEDLKKAKDELMELIRTINQRSGEMFRETFEQANANFEKMFTKLFNGGTAKLVIVENEEDPLECGVEIIARPPGKRLQSISLLSGGERTMTAVSLLFAIYLIKPSPFCLLDELDAALDDSNIGRFVQALKDFLVQSQFLIITHNQHSIANSGIVYGVTMPEKGVSKIVSMRLPNANK